MAARPDSFPQNVTFIERTVEAGQTVAVGRVVKDGDADGEIQHTTDGVDAIGIVYCLGKLAGAAGDKVTIALFGSGVVPVKVGTGGATRGKFAKCVADGVTSAVPDVATPAAMNVVGYFTQTGVPADVVGLCLGARGWLTE